MQHDLSPYHQLDKQLLADLLQTPAGPRTACGYEAVTRDGTVMIASAAFEPGINANRAIGLGQLPPEAAIPCADQVIDTYKAKGIGQYFMQLGHAPAPDLTEHLEKRGLAPTRAWQIFHRTPCPVEPGSADFDIEPVEPHNAHDFGEIVTSCFGLGSSFREMVEAAVCLPNWHGFVAYDGRNPAGCGCLLVCGDAGMLMMGATLPDFRGRGVQQALIAARTNKAHKLGLAHLYTATGVAVPGEPQHSYNNIERAGFSPWLLQHNYAPQ